MKGVPGSEKAKHTVAFICQEEQNLHVWKLISHNLKFTQFSLAFSLQVLLNLRINFLGLIKF